MNNLMSLLRAARNSPEHPAEPKEGVVFIASMVVAQAASAAGRTDVVAPATRHPETVRNDSGHILSVPGLIRFS